MKIVVENVYPPIPVRQFDWQAYQDGYEPGDSAPVGWGSTREAAISDLLTQMVEQEDLSGAEQKDQALRCGCRGSDDYCGCQNVPDQITISARVAKKLQETRS